MEVEKLIEEAVKSGAEESKYILIAEEIDETGSLFLKRKRIEVKGDHQIFCLKEERNQFGYRRKIAIIPRENHVVVIQRYSYSTSDELDERLIVSVFNGDCWKSLAA